MIDKRITCDRAGCNSLEHFHLQWKHEIPESWTRVNLSGSGEASVHFLCPECGESLQVFMSGQVEKGML